MNVLYAVIALANELTTATKRNEFKTVFRIAKEFAYGSKCVDGFVITVDPSSTTKSNRRNTTLLNRITSIWKKNHFGYQFTQQEKSARVDGLPAELFIDLS